MENLVEKTKVVESKMGEYLKRLDVLLEESKNELHNINELEAMYKGIDIGEQGLSIVKYGKEMLNDGIENVLWNCFCIGRMYSAISHVYFDVNRGVRNCEELKKSLDEIKKEMVGVAS